MEAISEVVFVLGGPGSGKGTLCSRIVDGYGYVHLSAGDLLRAEREAEGPTAELINRIILEGGIVPAEITVGLLAKAMIASDTKRFLIDGFPRNADNLLTWYDMMSATTAVSFVLNLDLSEEDMLARLLERGKSSGRSDDNLETITKRFKTFYKDTMPVLEMFSMAGKLRTISSLSSPAVVFRRAANLFDALNILKPYQRTFALIKPDAVANGTCPDILAAISLSGLTVVKMKVINMSVEAVREFYGEHEGKSFFPNLSDFMTSGPAVALILEGTDAVRVWRNNMGPTNSLVAREQAPESIRGRFGTDGTKNASHGSDSEKSALIEINFWMGNNKDSAGYKCECGSINSSGIIDYNIDQTDLRGLNNLNISDNNGNNNGNGNSGNNGSNGDESGVIGLKGVEDTFAMIKPLTATNNSEEIISVILAHGFEVIQQLHTSLSLDKAEQFYEEHSAREFFQGLTEYMSSGRIIALHLRRVSAISGWRHLIGPTNSLTAKDTRPDSIRAIFGIDGRKNACHGSDSTASAKREIAFFFDIGGDKKSPPLSPLKPLGPIRIPTQKQRPSPQVAVMSRADIALMQSYANEEVDPIIKRLLHQLMISRPSDVASFAIKELTDIKNGVPCSVSLPAIKDHSTRAVGGYDDNDSTTTAGDDRGDTYH